MITPEASGAIECASFFAPSYDESGFDEDPASLSRKRNVLIGAPVCVPY
jgi:hypothetical protein